jgi:6-phosphogluconolactonase (cycloisomerase 2 family)
MLTFDRSGKRLYVASQNVSGGMYGFDLDADTGMVTPISGSPFHSTVNFESRGVVIDPYNRYMVLSRTTGAGITVFSINGDGSVSEVPGQTLATAATPIRFTFVSAKQ